MKGNSSQEQKLHPDQMLEPPLLHLEHDRTHSPLERVSSPRSLDLIQIQAAQKRKQSSTRISLFIAFRVGPRSSILYLSTWHNISQLLRFFNDWQHRGIRFWFAPFFIYIVSFPIVFTCNVRKKVLKELAISKAMAYDSKKELKKAR